MDFESWGYLLVYVVFAFVPFVSALLFWPKRSVPGGRWLVLLLLAAGTWALTEGVASVPVGTPLELLAARVSYASCAVTPALLLLFALEYSGRIAPTVTRPIAPLFVVPAVATVAVFTNELHHGIWASVQLWTRDPQILTFTHGPLYWGIAAYGLVLSIAATVMLVDSALRCEEMDRSQSQGVAIAAMIPWLAELMYSAAPSLFKWFDPSLGVGLSATVLAYVMVRYRLLELLPVARDILVDQMPDGLLVVDRAGRIVDANYTARHILSTDTAGLIGMPLSEALDAWPSLAEAISAAGEESNHFVTTSPTGADTRIETWAMRDPAGVVVGKAILLRDGGVHAHAALAERSALDSWDAELEELHRTLVGHGVSLAEESA